MMDAVEEDDDNDDDDDDGDDDDEGVDLLVALRLDMPACRDSSRNRHANG